MEAKVLRIAGVEASLERYKVVRHPQQLAVLQAILRDERAVARDVRVLLIGNCRGRRREKNRKGERERMKTRRQSENVCNILIRGINFCPP